MPGRKTADTIGRLSALADPMRRTLYFYVAGAPGGGAVSRDQAARGARVSRALAAFHLDKLVEAGLLQASYRRLTTRRGPGAGRPAKLYRRSDLEVGVSLPPRDYELAARLFAPAVSDARLRRTARAFGTSLGREARRRAGSGSTRAALLRQLEAVLRAHGYEPFHAADGTLRLRNCPFHALVRDYRPLVCGMNEALLGGVVRGLKLTGWRAVLDPQPGMCCVALQ